MPQHSKKAFTLIELIVVMAIIAIMSSLGILGMIFFRRTVQVENTAQNLLSNLKTYENMSRNSVPSIIRDPNNVLTSNVDGYAVFADPQTFNYSLYYCINVHDYQGNFDCRQVEKSNIKLAEYNDVRVIFQGCNGILFERLTGKIYSISSNTGLVVPAKVGTCTILISHSYANIQKKIKVDFVNNNYSLL